MPALMLAIAVFVPAPAPAQPAEEAALQARIVELAGRAQALADVSAIKKLQRIYGFYLDAGRWDEAASLFAKEGSLEIGDDGVFVGPRRIGAYLSARRGGDDRLVYGQLNIHMQLQPVIHVAADGRTARGRWRDFGLEGEYRHSASWGDGVYENEYVKEAGVWKIARLRLYTNFVAPYEGGWTKLKPAPADWSTPASRALGPDRPSSAETRPFPEVFVPPFHYAPGEEQ